MLWIIADGAFAATAKPSTPVQSNATIYFLRPSGIINPWSPDIKLDGRIVGELSAGNYFVISCPRGRHTIEVRGIADGGYESELQVEAGKSYFIEIGPKPSGALGDQLLTQMLAGNTGQLMPGRGFWGKYAFYLLDAEQGRAKIANLRKITR
jgi:hypothetical protein